MRKIIYVNKTTNTLIKEYGFTNYILKRDEFLQTQQNIDIKINCSVPRTIKNFYRCLIREMTASIYSVKNNRKNLLRQNRFMGYVKSDRVNPKERKYNMKKIKGYDVYFTLESPACVLVAATSHKEAKEKALDIISNMSREELVDRLLAAYDFSGMKICHTEFVDELEEGDIK